jgi:LysR family hydrogen peroxide-inducible transcriptional activator
MDIKQLQALVGIADHGSFSAAAEALDTVQSNISGRIARLEKELNTDLVDRSTGRLTSSGEIVVVRARRILSEVSSIGSDVVALDAAVQGEVSIGLIGTTGRWLVPQLLQAQRSRYPLIRLRMVEGTNSSLEPRLVSGQLELAVLSQPISSPDITDTELFEEDLVLIVPVDDELAVAATPVTLEQLATMDLLLPLTGTSIRREIDDACAARGLKLRAIVELDGMRTLASLAFDGYGRAILPATALPSHLQDRFRAVPIAGLPPRRVGLGIRRYGFPSTPVRAIRQLLFQLVAEAATLPQGVHPLVGPEMP